GAVVLTQATTARGRARRVGGTLSVRSTLVALQARFAGAALAFCWRSPFSTIRPPVPCADRAPWGSRRTPMKVLALTEAPNHVCYRYRVEAFAGALNRLGWTLESLPLEPNTFQRSPQLRAAAGADVVILQRRMLPLWQLRILRRAARVLVYDFDDALFCRD